MGRELGRISGPLLADNLLRRGQNLAFETQLLYFDVVSNRVGINTMANAVGADLFVSTSTNVPYLDITTQGDLANFIVSGNTIHNGLGSITIQPNQTSDPTIVVPTLATDNLNFNTNYIQNTLVNDSVNITATGTVKLNANTLVSGSLEVTGNITFDGNVTLGDQNTDTVTFNAEVNSDILPSATGIYSLGSALLNWSNLYSASVTPGTANTANLASNNVTAGSVLFKNNTIYNNTPGQSVQFQPNGTGVVNLNNFVNFNNNTINNTSNNALTFASTSIPTISAVWKFNATSAVVIPSNDATNYVPEEGTIRYNTTSGDPEVYSSTDGWVNLIGPRSSVVNQNQFQDDTLVFTLMLGF
jgi:hypothetical protein